MKRISVDFLTNLAPHYRGPLWKGLMQSTSLDARFSFGQKPGSSIRTIDFSSGEWRSGSDRIQNLKNRYISGVLVWQSGALKQVWRTDAKVVVLLGQMYVVSTWLVAVLARMRGIRTVSWGHGAYGNEGGLKRWLRNRFLGLTDLIMVYGERARGILIESGFSPDTVRVVYNSLAHDEHRRMRSTLLHRNYFGDQGWFADSTEPVLIFVGRLTLQKRLEHLIKAVERMRAEGRIFNLLFVGDGSQRQALEDCAEKIVDQVYFFGPCYDEQQLGMMIANADLCVSPGEVGLTAIHSLSFGTPVCTHDDFDHQMPEAEAVIPGRTGIFFSRETMNLTDAIKEWFSSGKSREEIRRNCFEIVDAKWNTGNQIRIFERAVHSLCDDRL